MKQSNEKNALALSTVICILASVFVVLKMITGSNLFLLVFLILMTFGIAKDAIENKILYILYFIPWAYVIKFSFDQMSLITVLSAWYCIISVIYILLYRTRISIFYIAVIVSIFLYSFLSVITNSNASIVGILSFLLNFVVIYFATLFVRNKKLIPRYILFHSLGLTVSGLVNFLGNSFPEIENYMMSFTVYHTVYTTNTLYTRFTGLDMDPNYFSMQVLIAISCLCIIVFSNKVTLTYHQKMFSYLFIIMLSVMGILTLSKMFLISFGLLIGIVLILLLKENFKKGIYYIVSISSVLGITTYIFYDYLYQAFFFRFFSGGNTATSITSGRSDIWMSYYNEITGNPRILFLGNGVASEFFNGRLSHNMYLIAWYYLGILGILLFLILFLSLYMQLKYNLQLKSSFSPFSLSTIPLIIAVIANFALDSFIMEYFGIHVFLIIMVLVLNLKDDPDMLQEPALNHDVVIT